LPRKLLLDVSDELWTRFKATVSKNETLNEAILRLIQREVDKRETKI